MFRQDAPAGAEFRNEVRSWLEANLPLYLKRATLLSSLFGNAAAQRRRYVTIAGLTA